jgi:peflin
MYGSAAYGGYNDHLNRHSSVASRHSYASAPPQGPGYNYSSRPPAGNYYGPPQGADPQLWQYFSAVDADHSGSISVNELQTALVNGKLSGDGDVLASRVC